jgi:hypothetical protein
MRNLAEWGGGHIGGDIGFCEEASEVGPVAVEPGLTLRP